MNLLVALCFLAATRVFAGPLFDTSTPVNFFTNVANRLVATELNLNLPQLQVYPTSQYTPSLQRLLQVTANIYDATTTNPFPSVFRPLFSGDGTGTNIFITGYQQVVSVTGADDPQLAAPVDVSALPNLYAQAPFTNLAINVYGIPWIVGAKKGLPNFNQFYMRNTAQVTRKLEVQRADGMQPGGTVSNPTTTNQLFTMSITNRIGFSFWNSYNNDYTSNVPNGLTVFLRDTISMTLTNETKTWNTATAPIFSANLTIWPGSHWDTYNGMSAPQLQTPDPQSFVSGYFDFASLPERDYNISLNDFAISGTGSWDTTQPPLPFPRFGLLTTNWLQAYILDGSNVIDYVQMKGPNSARDLTEEVRDKYGWPNIATYNNHYNAGLLMWLTNGVVSSPTTRGVLDQIFVSRFNPAGNNAGFWKVPTGMPTGMLQIPAAESAFFNGVFTVDYFYGGREYLNTNLVVQAPYTPTVTVWEYTSWQANDPLVHYLASDLNVTTSLTGLNKDDGLTHEPFPSVALNYVNDNFQPWGRNNLMSQYANVDRDAYASLLRDPLIWYSDNWDFPTGQAWNLNWIGRVHRGTPWQTVFLKSANVLQETTNFGPQVIHIGTNTWQMWTGNSDPLDAAKTCPVSDWRLVNDLAAMLNTNDLASQFSINNPDPNAWAALLDGFNVLTNITDVPASYTPPVYSSVVVSSNSSQAVAIANAILSAQGSQPFRSIGDVLAAAQLAEQSPYLNLSDTSQQEYGVGDEAYEAIASQLLPRLRMDSIGALVSSNGQWQVQFSGYDGHVYVLQVSPDLMNWTNVSTNSPVNGVFSQTIAPSGNSTSLFYRTVLVQ